MTKQRPFIFSLALYGILWALLYTLLHYIHPRRLYEAFAASPSAAWAPFNTFFAKCPRHLAFSKFTDATYPVTERAQISPVPASGTCLVSTQVPNLPAEYAIVEEDTLTYTLQALCYHMPWQQRPTWTRKANTVTFQFPDTTIPSLLPLFLLTPLFIELADGALYIPDNTTRVLSNLPGALAPTLTLHRLIPRNQKSPSSLFTSPTASPSPSSAKNDARIFYLTPSNTAGRRLSFPNSELHNHFPLFDKNYNATISDKSSNEFFFHQRMHLLWSNEILPTLTFKMEILLPQALISKLTKPIQIFNAYADHPDFTFTSCDEFIPLAASQQKNNSIVSVLATSNGLTIATGKKSSICFDPISALTLSLPMLPNTERVLLIFTVAANNITAFAQGHHTERFFTFKTHPHCSTANNLHLLFSKPTNMSNAFVQYDPAIVRKLHWAHLGHINYLEEKLF